MFKKTLAAVAVLGAFAGSAFAANVTLYGSVDTGLGYTAKDFGHGDDTHLFDLRSGMNGANKFGLKGVEELGNGMNVGFSLENGFKIDSGSLGTSGRIFDREALIYVNGAFGEIAAGRMGELASGNGRYGLFGGKVSPISTGWDDIAGHKYVMAKGFARLDNMVTYKSPSFAGVNVLAQYSFKASNLNSDGVAIKGREGSSEVDRQYGLGVSYTAGDLYLAGIVTQKNVKSTDPETHVTTNPDDPLSVSLGGNYNFGVAKVYVAGQYFKDSGLYEVIETENAGKQYDGFGLSVGADVPVAGGTAKVLVAAMDAEDQAKTGAKDMKRYAFSVGYEYPLSKRTTVYGGAGYYMDDYDAPATGKDDKASVTAVNLGIMHSF